MITRRRGQKRVTALAVAALVASLGLATPSGAGAPDGGQRDPLEPLGPALLRLVDEADLAAAYDFGPVENTCPGAALCPPVRPLRQPPNVDLAVIEFDDEGHATAAANVLLSRDHPDGVLVTVDGDGGPAGSFGVSSVRWRRWDMARFDGGTFEQTTGRPLTVTGWADRPARTAADDVVAGRESAPVEFMAPYPASLFKVVVAFRIMRLVDDDRLRLDDVVRYDPAVVAAASATDRELDQELEPAFRNRRAGEATPPQQTVRQWMFAMIAYSDNDATRALLKLLADRGDLPAMHAELRALGLGTLQINGINPRTGGNWQPGAIHMTSMDTARLLWLIDAESGSLWTRPDGGRVRASMLSDSSRAFLKSLLHDQGYHEALSTTNFCGVADVSPGIPARISPRWINPDGTVTVHGYAYGRDVRPCNAAAEVSFAHKTGLTFNYGANAGIVRSLPGRAPRHYIISFISNLGYRYTDRAFAARPTYPCFDPIGPVCYTQRIPALAQRIDGLLAAQAAGRSG